PEGDRRDAPPPVQWPSDGWLIKPDLIISGIEYRVPAHTENAVVPWMYVTVPSGLAADTWASSVEIRPSEPSVTHHVCVLVKPHAADVVYNVPVWADRRRDAQGNALAGEKGTAPPNGIITGANLLGCYVPGKSVEDYRPYQAAALLPAGSDFIFQLHYTPNGKETIDRPRIGLTLAPVPPRRQYVPTVLDPTLKSFAIPP